MCAAAAERPARADEVSAQQEQKRAPLREAYVKAKQAEKEARDKRQAVIDRMTQMLAAGTRDFTASGRQLADAEFKLAEKRQALKLAERDWDVALGSHGRNANDPAVVAAKAKRDALAGEIEALDKQVAQLRNDQAGKSQIDLTDQVFADLKAADAELDANRQLAVETLAVYMAALRPEPPPYLQSVTVFAGARRMYFAEWRIDDKAADEASRDFTDRLEKLTGDINRALREMQQAREELRDQRIEILGPMIAYSGEISLAALDIRFAGMMVVLAPAIIEAIGVVIEAGLTGGTSTAERYATGEAVDAGLKLAEALAKKRSGKVVSLAEQAVIDRVEKSLDLIVDQNLKLVQTKMAKSGADKFMNWRANDLTDRLGLKPGISDAAKILVSDATEQVIQRTVKAGGAVLSYKTITALATASGDKLTAWQAVRSGGAKFFSAKAPLGAIKDGFKGTRSANLLGLAITSAKALAAAYYGAKLGEAEQRYIENMALFDGAYQGYAVLLQSDRVLFDKQREFQDLYFQTFAYRLQSAGPRALSVIINDGNNDPEETLTFRLRFSRGLDRPPQVRIAGLEIEMKPQDVDAGGRSSYWEGKLPVKKLPNNIPEGVLDVSLGDGSKPYTDLDSDPASAARFNVPDDLAKTLAEREEWTDYQRGADRNHRIALKPNTDQKPVPWTSHSTCDKITCDCGAVSGYGAKICSNQERELREDCFKHGQTMGTCGVSGPNAYPKPLFTIKPPAPPQPLQPPPRAPAPPLVIPPR